MNTHTMIDTIIQVPLTTPIGTAINRPVDMSLDTTIEAHDENITMTRKAIDHVYTMLTGRGHGIGLRLGIKTLGCSGYAYDIGFLDETQASDKLFKINRDITIAVDNHSYPFVKGTVIDFTNEGLGQQFKFDNPNAKNLCGCGESFNI